MEKTHSNVSKTNLICRYAVCLALLVVCAQIVIALPFTPVPVTLAYFMVFVIGGLLGPVHGALCMLIYIIMGLVGIPVFAGFNSFSALAGPTGGYIVGYVPMAMLSGLFVRRFNAPIWHFVGMTLGMSTCYLCGAVWYMIMAKVSFAASLVATVLPFILADICKMILAYLIIRRLRKLYI